MKTKLLFAAAAIFTTASIASITVSAYELGRESNAHTLDNCMNGIDIMHNGKLIRCGIIHRVDNLAAARYRGVKNCVKLIKEWEDGNN